MARTAKKEKALTPEEKLAQALVPDVEQPYRVPENWCWGYLTASFAECKDSYRKPINATERAGRIGSIPYYGATGQVGWIDDYLTDEELVLLGEDGAPFLDLNKDKAYLILGKAWVNNHAHILKSFFGHAGNLYLLHYLNAFNYTGYVNGTTRLKLTQSSMDTIPVPIAPLAEQQRIVDRIESLFVKLDEAKEKAQAVVDGFEDRRAAILHKAFTGELTAEWRKENGIVSDGSWKMHPLGEYANSQYGYTEKASAENVGPHFLRITDIQDGQVFWKSVPYCKIDSTLKDKYTLSVGDIVVEHLLPKGLPEYTHLQLDYKNLLCSCDGGEKERKGKNKQDKRKYPSHCDDKKSDDVLPLTPLDPKIEEQFKYDEEGHIYGMSPDAKKTIDILNLDCSTIVNRRKAAIKPYLESDFAESPDWSEEIRRLSCRNSNGEPYCFAVIGYIKEFLMDK